MNSTDLLGMIDLIKNTDLYLNRLEELKKAEQAVNEKKYMVATMEEADRYRNESLELKKQAEENLACIEDEVENRVKDLKQRLKEEQTKVNQERVRLVQWAEKLEGEQVSLFKQISDYKKLQDDLRKRGDEISLIQKQCRAEQIALANKVEAINKIFNKD